MSDLRDRLHALDGVEPPEQWSEIEGRRPGLPVRVDRGVGTRLSAAVVALAVAAAGTYFAVDRLSPDGVQPPAGSIAPIAPGAFDGWTVNVTLEHSASGPLRIDVGPIRAAEPNEARPWLQHAVVLRNTGDVPLHFDDTRSTALLGRPEPELFVADQGCGYGDPGAGRPLEWDVCLLYLDTFTLGPQQVERRDVTLWKDLRGLAPLRPGKYVFEKVYRFRVGQAEERHEVRVRLVYTIERAG
jgi:hypothetical protein